MECYKRFAVICCLVALLTFHGADAQVIAYTTPTAANNVASVSALTTAVAGSGVSWTAAIMVVEGASGTVSTVTATVTANVVGYTTASTEFDVHATTGVVSVAAAHTISFATKSSYSLAITAVETGAAAGVANSVVLTIAITVNASPVFSSPTVCWHLPDAQAATTTMGTYSATAETGETITYTVNGGNTGTDFSAAMTNGILVTANVMAMATTPAYMLELNAVDDAAVFATGTTYVAVIIRDTGTAMEACGAANGVIGSLLVVMSLFMAKFL